MIVVPPKTAQVVSLEVPAEERLAASLDLARDRASFPQILRIVADLRNSLSADNNQADNNQSADDLVIPLHAWIQTFRRVLDPPGGDVVACPLWTCDAQQGDCLTLATLVVCCALAAGLHARLVWLQRPCDPIDHVIAEVWVGSWLAIDAVHDGPIGSHSEGRACFRADTRRTVG